MGTSSSPRSPRTPAWKLVQRLYDDPAVPVETIVAHIVGALTPQTRAGMVDAAVTRCLGTLLGASARLPDVVIPPPDPALPAAADLASALRGCAQSAIARHREGSHFGEIALDALTAAALEVAAPAGHDHELARAMLAWYADERRLAELGQMFVSHDLAYVFRHFVERDTPAHIGGPRIKEIVDADRLASEIAALCRHTIRRLPLGGMEEDLWCIVEPGFEHGHALCQAALKVVVEDSLRALEGLPDAPT
ncbi:MAG: hypothetical protein ACUVX8_18145 [Candidatus Zipacnadales bacterium]